MGWKELKERYGKLNEEMARGLGKRYYNHYRRQKTKSKVKDKPILMQKFGKRSLTWKNLRLGWREIGIKAKMKVIILISAVVGAFAFAVWWIVFWARALGGA